MAWWLKFVVGFLALPLGLFVSVGLMNLAKELFSFDLPDWVFWLGYAVLCVILGVLAVWIL